MIKNDYADLPKPNPRTILKRELKKTLRAARVTDAQGRKVREMLPVKHEMVDEAGNGIFEVIWDHIHTMSLDHAFSAFDQRDININKQKLAATRDLQSCLENNPHVAGHKEQFQFDFMTEELEVPVVEQVEETKGPNKPR